MVSNNKKLKLSIIIRGGNDLKGLLRCIKSIDEQVEIIASVSNQAKFIDILKKMGIVVVTHLYGNWSNAAETGIKVSSYNNLIIMDSDSVFNKKAIRFIYDALLAGNYAVQPQVEFLTNNSWISKILQKSRTFENRYEPKSYSPGLGLRKKELIKNIGINGCIYNLEVKYGDDGNIDKRLKEKKMIVHVEPKAIIFHDTITLKHEIKTACQFGRGDYQGKLSPVVKSFFKNKDIKYLFDAYHRYGLGTMVFLIIWRFIYTYGYYSEKFSTLYYLSRNKHYIKHKD